MSKAAELAALIGSQSSLSNRNLIINGAMQVSQRGEDFGTLSSQAYTVDRWKFDSGVDVERVSLSVDEISEDTRLKYALKFLGNSGSQYFRQPIEDVTLFSGNTYTLSFWVKGSASTTLNNIYARQAFGSGGSSSVDTAFSPISHSVTTSYTKYIGTVTLPSISGKTVGSGNHLELFMQVPNGTSIYLTGVQLEVGEQATPFEHRSFGEELDRCKRYYQNSFAYGTAPANDIFGVRMAVSKGGDSTVYGGARVDFEKTMRAIPTITAYNPLAAPANSGAYLNDINNSSTTTQYAITGINAYEGSARFVVGGFNQGGNDFGCNWTADAEL